MNTRLDCATDPELRMLRSIAADALLDAWRTGHASATFHEFTLDAWRLHQEKKRRPATLMALMVYRRDVLLECEVHEIADALVPTEC